MSTPEHPALATLRAFVDANQRQDTGAMRECFSRNTIEAGGFSASLPEGFRFQAGAPEPDPRGVVIPLDVFSADAADVPLMTMRCVMVDEQGTWKLDLLATMEPQVDVMESALRDALRQAGRTMNDLLDETGDAFVEALIGRAIDQTAPEPGLPEPSAESEHTDARPQPRLPGSEPPGPDAAER
ncbi:MAG: hypothetical protein ACOYN0_00720 [Phycisphaerales bacterium]